MDVPFCNGQSTDLSRATTQHLPSVREVVPTRQHLRVNFAIMAGALCDLSQFLHRALNLVKEQANTYLQRYRRLSCSSKGRLHIKTAVSPFQQCFRAVPDWRQSSGARGLSRSSFV